MWSRRETEGEQPVKSDVIDPKPGDLSMGRLKLPYKAMEDRTDPR